MNIEQKAVLACVRKITPEVPKGAVFLVIGLFPATDEQGNFRGVLAVPASFPPYKPEMRDVIADALVQAAGLIREGKSDQVIPLADPESN